MAQLRLHRLGAMQQEMRPTPGVPIFGWPHLVELHEPFERVQARYKSLAQILLNARQVSMTPASSWWWRFEVFRESFVEPKRHVVQFGMHQGVRDLVAQIDRQLAIQVGEHLPTATGVDKQRAAIRYARHIG